MKKQLFGGGGGVAQNKEIVLSLFGTAYIAKGSSSLFY